MVLREANDPLNQSRGIMGPLENATGVQNNRGRLRQRFDLIRKLGQGTYGKVQLGIDKETGQEVAIKTIKKSKIETEADLIRIRREIQIMSSVRHPNIIHIYEVFENREKMVLVMEYAAGGELYDYLNERKVLQDDEARRIFRQIASAVYYCHKHKICHRDLKLENILLDEKFNAKIADFGLSNVFDEVNLLKTFCGSPLYASPEIVRGTPYRGPEVDCWSLGVLLYTLVYGAMPFDGSNFKRLVKQISHGDYFEPKKPAEASPLIRIMLTVDPKKRADIRKCCAHPWVNVTFDQDCLAIADELATQTPVRLDLLLALANCPAINHSQVVIQQQQPNAEAQGQAGNNVDQGGAGTSGVAVANHIDGKESKDQPKKPKRMKVQSKSKSSPMLELIRDVGEEELELPPHEEGNERDEEDACDTLSEISEIQTLAEDVEGGAISKAATIADTGSRTRDGKIMKRDRSKVRGEAVTKAAPSPSPASPATPVNLTPTPATPTPTPPAEIATPKKTEIASEPKAAASTPIPEPKAPAKKVPTEPPSSTPTPTEDKAPVKKKIVKPKTPVEPEKPSPVEEPPVTPTVAPAPAAAEKPPTPKEAVPSASPSPARETTGPSPAQKEKSATPPDKRDSTPASDSGEETRSRASKLKDRADSVSPTRIERRNSKVISQKTAELIQNLETKVSPSGSTTMEPPPKPPGIKKIVIPSFKVADAKSKFESKPPRPLTTSVSRSKAAFEAKLQSQSSVEEKTPPPKQAGKSESPPADVKPKVETPSNTAEKVAPATAAVSVKEEPKKVPEAAKNTEPPKMEKPTTEDTAKVEAPANKVTVSKGPGKIQIPAVLAAGATEKVPPAPSSTSEVKPVLMDAGKGGAKPAVMVVKGKISPMPDARTISTPASTTPSPAQEPLTSPKPTLNDPQSNVTNSTNTNTTTASSDLSASIACNESIAPPESDTEGETGKTGGTPVLGPAAAAKQKLLSKLPPPVQQQPAVTVNSAATATNGGPNKEQAVKKISSAITKIATSGSADKGLNTEEGPKKFSTLPRAAKPESEKLIKTEVSFPVSAPSIPISQPPPATPVVQQQEKPQLQTQQSQQERIIPIKFMDEVVGSPPATPAANSVTAAASTSQSQSMASVNNASRSSLPQMGSLSRQESYRRMDSSASNFSRQNSSDTESCSMATVPHKFEQLKKCPREFLIPIKLEGSGHTVTPKEELASGGSTADASLAGEDDFRVDSRLRSGRFPRPKRYSSLLSDSSFDEDASVSVAAGGAGGVRRSSAATTAATPATSSTSATHTRSRSQGDEPTTPGGAFKRYRNRRHATAAADMPLDRSDSFSSAEEDEADEFQVLTAESLFTNLLDRVRNLTRRINRDDPLMTPNWSTDPATFGLWGASPLRDFMSSRAPSESRSFGSSAPGNFRRESSVTVGSAGGPGGAWRRSLSRDLSGDSDSGHSASMNTANAQSRSQLSRLSSDLYETGSARSLPLSTRRSPSYLSHRSVDNDLLGSSYGSPRSYTRTLSHSAASSDYGTGRDMPPSSAVSRTLPLRRSLKTFDRSPQNILPEYDTTGPGGGGSLHHHHLSSSGSLRHSLLDSSSKYDNHSTYLSRLRSASRDRSDREGSVVSGGASSSSRIVRTLYPTGTSSGEANGWEGGQDAGSTSSSLAASSYSTTSGILASGGGSSISPISTTVSLNSESLLSPTSSFSLEVDSPGSSASRLLSVQEKMNNYSQYYQSLTQNPFRRLPLASPSQIHASSSSSFGVGLSEIRNAQPPPILSRPVAFQPQPAVVPLKVEPPSMEIGPASSTSTSDEGSATPCIQSPVSNPLSSVTSPSISPRQMVSPVTVASPIKSPQEISPKSLEEIRASKPPSSSSIPRWPTVSVRQHRPLSISSFPDGPRASSVSRVMSPPPPLQQPERNGVTPAEISPSTGIGILKRRDSRATSVERITRLLERKSIPREVNNATTTAATGGDTISQNKTKVGEESTSHIMNGNATASEIEKSSQSSLKKPKFLQSLEKKWEKLTHSGSVTKVVEQHDETVKVAKPSISELKMNGTTDIDVSILSTPASPEPNQAGATSEESSSHEDTKFNESVLLRRALSPEKKVKTNRLASSGGTVGFMLGKFKKLEETPPPASSSVASNTSSRIPTGRPPMAVNGASALTSRLGRRLQMPYAGTTSDSVLTLTAKEMGRTSDISSGDENGLIRSAAAIAQEKRRLQHPRLEVKKDIPTTQEGPSSPPVSQNAQKVFSPPVVPPQIHIQDDPVPRLNDEEMPKMDLSSLSPISVSEGDRTESDESTGTNIKSDSANANDDAESVSDRILRKSFYNRFNASGHKQPNAIDRNRRSHSVTPGSSRRTMPNSGTANLRVNSGGGTSPSTKGSSNGTGHQAPLRRSVSPAASTVASAESKDSSDQSSSQNRSPSPYWSGLNKYNPNPLFKELMVTEDLRSNNDVGKKTEYSRRITSKLSKLLREIESDLNSCQLTKTGSGVSDDGDSTSLLLGAGGSGVGVLGGSVVGHLHSNSLIPNRVTSPIPATTSAGTGSLLKRGSKFNANETNGN